MIYSDIFSYIETYGYLALFVGSFFEGETLLILAGLFSHQGHLSFAVVLFLAFIGAVIGDGSWFLVGRYRFPKFIHSKSWFQRLSQRPVAIVEKNPKILAFSMRFMYGFRTLIPLGLGMSNIPTSTYFLYNSLGAALWVVFYGLIGYFFGEVLEIMFGRIKHLDLILIATVIVMVVGFLTGAKLLRRHVIKPLQQENRGNSQQE